MTRKSPQSGEMFWIYEVAITPEKLGDFLSVARDLMAAMEQEPGTLEYRYSMNAENTICHIYERYRDSAGLIAHAKNFGRTFAERFTKACSPLRFSVYGVPSDDAETLLGQYGAAFFSSIITPCQ